MKNIQVIDGAANATFSIFQATEEEFRIIFPDDGQDLEVIEDMIERVGEERAAAILTPIWNRPIHKRETQGIHGTLFYDYGERAGFLPPSRREIDRDPSFINAAQRALYASLR